MANLTDIAKECNVSTATVSYVLSGQGDARRISLDVQEKILKSAESLGYTKKNTSRKNQCLKIGFFWPDKHLETTIANALTGINMALQFESAPIEISMFPFISNNLSAQASLWCAKSFDATVILSPNTADINYLTQHHTKMPTILINRFLDGYYSVSTDYKEVGRLAAEQAIAKGEDNISLIRNIVPHLGMNHRSQAIYDVCKQYGVNLDSKMHYCSNGIDDAYELGLRLIREKKLSKVIVCVYDTDAFGLSRALTENGVVVGEDVELIATSTSYPQFFSRSTPSITVVDLKLSEISQRAIRMAINIATGQLSEPTKVTIRPEIIYRESSPFPSFDQMQKLAHRLKTLPL